MKTFKIYRQSFDGITGAEASYSLDEVFTNVWDSRGWDNLQQLRAKIRIWAEKAKPGSTFPTRSSVIVCIARTIATLLLLTAAAQAQTLFDSGEPQGRNGYALGGGYYCDLVPMPWTRCQNWSAVQMIFLDTTSITKIEGYLSSINEGVSHEPEEGVVRLALYSGDLPDERIKQVDFTMDDQLLGWYGPDVDWQLEPGKYWFAFEVSRESKWTGGWNWGAPVKAAAIAGMHGDYQNQTAEVWKVSSSKPSVGFRLMGYAGDLAAGDINRDGLFTLTDLDLEGEALKAGSWDSLYDLDFNGVPLVNDWRLLREKIGVEAGDANANGHFNSSDLLQLFQTGEYEDGIVWNSTWADGDFTGDFEFDSGDLVAALATGSYETTAVSVPEPSGATLIAIGLTALLLLTNAGRGFLCFLLGVVRNLLGNVVRVFFSLLVIVVWLMILPLSIVGWLLLFDGLQEKRS